MHQRFTFEDYLVLEETSTVNHEFSDGRVWAMAGGTPEDGAVAANVIALLASQLRDRPCRVFTSDVRIRVGATGLATYPDVSEVCGTQQTDPDDPKGSTLVNPALIVEVLSPFTEDYDRGEKLAHYKQIPSLDEVALVAHEERRLEIWRRQDDHRTIQVHRGEETASVAPLGCELSLAEVYRNPLAGRGWNDSTAIDWPPDASPESTLSLIGSTISRVRKRSDGPATPSSQDRPSSASRRVCAKTG